MTNDRRVPDDPRADRELWDLVGAVPVPPAAPDFLPRLQTRLAAAAVGGVSQPAAVLPGPRARSRRGRVSLIAAAAAVAVAAAVFALIALPALRTPDTATAADMLASMNAAQSGGATVVRLFVNEGLVHVTPSASPSPGSSGLPAAASEVTPEVLIMSTSGDLRWTVTGRHKLRGQKIVTRDYWTQDEEHHQTMSYGGVTPDDGNSVLAIERPSWGTDVYEAWPYASIQAAASALRALLAEIDPKTPVTEVSYLGRPAWHAVFEERSPATESHPGGVVFGWNVTVDKATGLLLESDYGYQMDPDGEPVTALAFWVTRVDVDPALPKGWQRLSERGRERIITYDHGTRFGTPESVAKRSRPTPVLIPGVVPAGYRLSEVATTYFQGMRESPTNRSRLIYLSYHHPRKCRWVMTSIDASTQRVVARYRRGFFSFVIDIRPPSSGKDEMPSYGTPPKTGEDVTLDAGYLKGCVAKTSIAPGPGPILGTHIGRYTVTIYGDLTRQELVDVADSLQAAGQ